MTTIAWDGITLAGDKQTNLSGAPTLTTKVHAATRGGRNWLFGCAGNSGRCRGFWHLATGEIDKLDLAGVEILCVDDTGQLWYAEDGLDWIPIADKCWAIGSGRDFAMGAMAMGATAVEAVRIASKLNNSTGLGVDWVRF